MRYLLGSRSRRRRSTAILVEVYQSREMLKRRGRTVKTTDEARLITEEGKRQETHESELRRLLKLAILRGAVYFRGNDRSPDELATDLTEHRQRLVGFHPAHCLQPFWRRCGPGADQRPGGRAHGRQSEWAHAAFTNSISCATEGGRVVFATESGPLAEVAARIANRHQYGESASGRYLTDEFGKEPFGWEFDTVRLLTACLLRAGKVEMTSKGQTVDSATGLDARTPSPTTMSFARLRSGPSLPWTPPW